MHTLQIHLKAFHYVENNQILKFCLLFTFYIYRNAKKIIKSPNEPRLISCINKTNIDCLCISNIYIF